MSKPFIVRSLMKGQICWLVKEGFDVTICTSKGLDVEWIKAQGAKVKLINFSRKPDLLNDIKALVNLIIFLRKNSFDIIHYSTPKTSFLSALSSLFLKKNHKYIYTMRGRAYENFNGFKRFLYELIEKFICSRSDKVIFVSYEHKKIFEKNGYVSLVKSTIFCNGSSNGFDEKIFKKVNFDERSEIRAELNIEPDSFVIGFLGRLCVDKGINDFLEISKWAFQDGLIKNVLLVGPDEINIKNKIKNNKFKESFIVKEWVKNPEQIIQSMDIMFFPSAREGFGNVCIESALCGIPVIAYDVAGCRESVKNEVSGYLLPYGDLQSVKIKILELIQNKNAYNNISKSGNLWAKNNFTQEKIWKEIKLFYENLDE